MAREKTQKRGDIYQVKVDKDSGRVEIRQWMGGDQYETRDVEFVGKLITFKLADFEYKGKTKYKIQFCLQDGVQKDIIEFGFNYLSKNLVNHFYSLEPGKNVIVLSFYTKEGHAKVGVKVDGEKGKWFLTTEQVLKMNESGDTKWLDMAQKLHDKYKDFQPIDELDQMIENAKELVGETADEVNEVLDDDLPF